MTTRFLVSRLLPAAVRSSTRLPHAALQQRAFAITYSGGQPTEGQGGFYASGGARSNVDDYASDDETRVRMIALSQDVEKIEHVMTAVESLESQLRENAGVNGKSIELKSAIKKLMTDPSVLESLNRLELEGQPVWGLSTEEREMIIMAREKVNAC
ncbi:hypothetical protein FisN_20Hh147 [Fistulifera solaris]|uniref:Uncharacterized protein n=1 Tax=Fistulifera solaris TaxID=1519565 RepID=A0A1Z5KCD9_FISSO|nr:hypothetical protein FisN_20Hh147 [Fistulifera solaris]|eukprot:GAX23939.1 hypothetical protein FisN_20Hh147 [Fistulifera solaris]